MNMDQMLLAPVETLEMPTPPDTSHLITEDDTPVDKLFSEKQQRLLTEPLYSSWPGQVGAQRAPRRPLAPTWWLPMSASFIRSTVLRSYQTSS
jgi:hypothetical protein